MDTGQSRVFRVLWFMLPPGSIARNPQFQVLLTSRFLGELALQALYFAALIETARAGGTAFQAAMIGIAFLLPGVLLGLFGGAVADALPKRVALGVAYGTMGGLCLLIPYVLGTGFTDMLLVIFAVRVLHQVVSPAEASAAPLVASHEELASANSFLSLVSSAGDVVGRALLAPFVVRVWGINPVVVMAALFFFLSSLRIVKFRPQRRRSDQAPPAVQNRQQPDERAGETGIERMGLGEAITWLLREPPAFWMLMLAAMSSTIGVVLSTLGPEYVSRVLNVDPTFTFYVFAPVAPSVLVGLAVAPVLMRIFRERFVAIFGLVLVSIGIALLGQVDWMVDRFGGLLIVGVPGVAPQVEMAALLSIPIGFGNTLASAATQTYIGRYVPTIIHGRVFAILGTLKDALAMPQLLVLGAIAAAIGVQNVLTIAPFALLAVALGFERASARWRTPRRPDGTEAG